MFQKAISLFTIGLLFFSGLLIPSMAFADTASPWTATDRVESIFQNVMNLLPGSIVVHLKDKINIQIVQTPKQHFSSKSMSEEENIHAWVSVEKGDDGKWILRLDPRISSFLSCKNKSECDQKLQKFLLHQIVHIYDDMSLALPLNSNEKQILTSCRAWTSVASVNALPAACQIFLRQKKTLSDHNDFVERLYRYPAPDEAFPVLFTAYILDPKFSCSNPGMNFYFENRFGEVPKRQAVSCQRNFVVPYLDVSESSSDFLSLDPSRVFRIDYLLASEGEDMSSSQGHTMFRIVMCSPYRKEVSEACVNDTAHHISVGFAANQATDMDNIGGLANTWKGLTGGYPSILSIVPLYMTQNQYNVSEDRALKAYPLKLTKFEISNFVSQVIDTYWNHNRDYYFLNNNCATEGYKLIKRALNRPYHAIYNTDIKIISPKGLLDTLLRTKLIATRTDFDLKSKTYGEEIFEPDPKSERFINYFPSTEEIIRKNATEEDLKYFKMTSVELRRQFDKISGQEDKRRRYASLFRAIEQNRLFRMNEDYNAWIQNQILFSSDEELREKGIVIKKNLLNLMEKMRLRVSNSQDDKLKVEGSSIPSENELFVSRSQLDELQKSLFDQTESLREKLKKDDSFKSSFAGYRQLQIVQENFRYYDEITSQYAFPVKKM